MLHTRTEHVFRNVVRTETVGDYARRPLPLPTQPYKVLHVGHAENKPSSKTYSRSTNTNADVGCAMALHRSECIGLIAEGCVCRTAIPDKQQAPHLLINELSSCRDCSPSPWCHRDRNNAPPIPMR